MSALRGDQKGPQAALLPGLPVLLGRGEFGTVANYGLGRFRAGREDSQHLQPTGAPSGRRPEPDEPVTRGQLLTMLIVVYGLLSLAGWWWLSWRERTAVLAESAVGPHGPLAAVALGCSVGLGLFFTTRIIARYAPTFAELELRLARTLGPLDDRDALLIALVSAAAEEFFFRCAMQDALGLWLAVLLYAFGHATGPRQWLWSLQAGALALLFGWMVLGGFGILSAAVAHAVYGYLWLLRLTSR